MDPNAHPDHKTNQPNNQPSNFRPLDQRISQPVYSIYQHMNEYIKPLYSVVRQPKWDPYYRILAVYVIQ